jgi:phosphoglycolate phosphatase
MRTVIFDLDGTLADTSGDLIAAANACFRGLGLGEVLDPLRDQATAFRGGRAMLRLGAQRLRLDETLVEDEFPKLIAHYTAALDVHTTLYDGAVEGVEALRAAGYRVGICTNKPERQSELLLEKLGIRNLFQSLVAADTLPTRKPDPAPYAAAVERAGGALEQSMLIGDTVTDRETARAAGVPCVLVTFGPDGDAVREMTPEGLLPSYDALLPVVSKLIG